MSIVGSLRVWLTITALALVSASSWAASITSAQLASAKEGVAFSYQITTDGTPFGPNPFNATNLPGSLSIDSATGIISGTPAALDAGAYFPIKLSVNTGDPFLSPTLDLELVIDASGAPTFTTPAAQNGNQTSGTFGTVFTPYSIATSAAAPDFSSTNTLPPGLSITGTNPNFAITGTPTQAGEFYSRLKVVDGAGTDAGTVVLKFQIAAASTSVSLLSSQSTFTYGTQVTLTTTVSSGAGTPTGQVYLQTSTVFLGIVNLVNGTGTLDTSAIPGGNPTSIMADYYPSNPSFAGSSATPLDVTVTPATGTLAVSNTNGISGRSVNLTATLSPALAGKSISFTVDGSAAGSASTNASGVATLSNSVTQSAGAVVNFSASFAGDSDISGPLNSNTATLSVSGASELSALTSSSGALVPAFAPATVAYSIAVANSVSSTTVTPTAADAAGGATITVNGASVASGAASAAISLNAGGNTISIVVTPFSGPTKTYTVTVNRAKQDQTITFDLAAATLDTGKTLVLSASSTSSLTVAFASSDATIASIAGSTLTALKAGTVTITASQAGNTSFNAAADVVRTLTVVAGAKITSALTASANIGDAFTYTITGDFDPNDFFADLPIDLVGLLDYDAGTGVISGTLDADFIEAGTYEIELEATNTTTDATATATLVLTVSTPPAPVPYKLQTAFLSSGTVGTVYNFELNEQDRRKTLDASGLPDGLIFATGVISGTPKAAVTSQVTFSGIGVESKTLELQIVAKKDPPPPPPPVGNPAIVITQLGDRKIKVEVSGPGDSSHPTTYLRVSFGDGQFASNAALPGINIEWTQNIDNISPLGYQKTYFHTYAADGTYTIEASSRLASKIQFTNSKTVKIATPVSDPKVVSIGVTRTAIDGDPYVSVAADFTLLSQDLAFQASPALVLSIKNPSGKEVGFKAAPGYPVFSASFITLGSGGIYTFNARAYNGSPSNPQFTSEQTVRVYIPGPGHALTSAGSTNNGANALSLEKIESGNTLVVKASITSFNRADKAFAIDFGNGDAVLGSDGVSTYRTPGIYILKGSMLDPATLQELDALRKQLVVTRANVGLPAVVTSPPSSTAISAVKLSGKFSFLIAGADPKKLKNDQVGVSGTIELPGGLDFAKPQLVEIGFGNIVDKIVINAKGIGKGSFTSFKMSVPKDGMSSSGMMAKFSLKMSAQQLSALGFESDGVRADQTASTVNIQGALLIGGIGYETSIPSTLKLSKKKDKASLASTKK